MRLSTLQIVGIVLVLWIGVPLVLAIRVAIVRGPRSRPPDE